ncbi:hypothetical protein RchiOBHm_Chr1g0315711 [Rosa chinensis]|uniref:Arabinogalactan peptide 23-like n=1 Tax=Rosa chinensis TaxID=74649 RepID=A0A2P6S7F4_ROSCH|nr:arabinogalactan protein 23 [Rosa chinensis]PRQ54621.1 hypothetical protein RchiOBHm_Chr1g0315711 [Rosa chinensis]
MEMKKIACAVLFAAASVSAVVAGHAPAPAPGPAGAEAPTSGAAAASLPILGSMFGAFVAYYLQ